MLTEPITEEKRIMLEEVLAGLKTPQKSLPSKYFYDEKGSHLFDEITRLEEYYPTRTEISILEQNVSEITAAIGNDSVLIEPGSGNSYKTRILLEHMPELPAYIPMDISEEFLFRSAEILQEDFPHLNIIPAAADYTRAFSIPGIEAYSRKVIFFPGSTIGNFRKERARHFLSVMHELSRPNGGLLIGVDLVKPLEILEPAYNDANGITAQFNLNVLSHINAVLMGDFDPDLFRHLAFFNREHSRIEMHLLSTENQTVHICGEPIHIRKGETIHTENSHKYTLESFSKLVSEWFTVEKVWLDKNRYFSLQFLKPV